MAFFIVILILLLLPLIFPFISRMIKNYFMGKMEDRMRRMMGMPTRAEEKKARKAQEREDRRNGWNDSDQRQDDRREERTGFSRRYGFRGRGRNHNVGNPAESVRMMKSYAEDVEFVEIREYSAEIRFEQDQAAGNVKITLEEQMTDAEFVMVTV
ncbi:MAG: hypothetical protein K2N05_06460 [Muribaculaceae bacterium]|nr:hypothetical protein [Muribaculaceae bacterium]